VTPYVVEFSYVSEEFPAVIFRIGESRASNIYMLRVTFPQRKTVEE
jgi:hypothetical protein